MSTTSPHPLRDQTAIVTGSGIGAAIATAFAEAGARVGINYRSETALAEKAAEAI